MSMNLWSVTPDLLAVCETLEPSVRGELELPLAVRSYIRAHGGRVRCVPLTCGVLDLSRRGDVRAVAERLRSIVVAL